MENPKPLVVQGIRGNRGERKYDLDLFGHSVVVFTSLNRSSQDLQMSDQGEVPLVLVRS